MSQMKSGTSLYLTLISSYTFLSVSYKLSLVPALEFFQPFLYPTPYRNAMWDDNRWDMAW